MQGLRARRPEKLQSQSLATRQAEARIKQLYVQAPNETVVSPYNVQKKKILPKPKTVSKYRSDKPTSYIREFQANLDQLQTEVLTPQQNVKLKGRNINKFHTQKNSVEQSSPTQSITRKFKNLANEEQGNNSMVPPRKKFLPRNSHGETENISWYQQNEDVYEEQSPSGSAFVPKKRKKVGKVNSKTTRQFLSPVNNQQQTLTDETAKNSGKKRTMSPARTRRAQPDSDAKFFTQKQKVET